MKTGIMTFHFAHNYGAMLQAFALKTFLQEQGHAAEIINYVPEHMKVKYFQMSNLKMLMPLRRSVVKEYLHQKENLHRFNQFEKDYLDVDYRAPIRAESLRERTRQYDYIVFGSDQIWNTNITKADMHYFADFLPAPKAIAYAASAGDALRTHIFSEALAKHLNRFRNISVRERNAQRYIEEKFGKSVAMVLDPVFLLPYDDWKMLVGKSRYTPNGDYIFYYTIQDNSELAHSCNDFASQSGLQIIAAHGTMRRSNPMAVMPKGIGPIEFLRLMDGASCVFTNSFHAVAFSLIFGKKVHIRLHSETGNRVTDLLHTAGVAWDGSGELELDCAGRMSGGLADAIEKSQDYLKSALLEKDSFRS